VTGFVRDGHIKEPAVNNGGGGSCRIAYASSMSYGLFHEMGHGMRNGWGQSHSEIFCDFQQDLATGGRAGKHLCSVAAPWRNATYWCYPTTLFYTFVGEDPNWGYCAVDALPTAAAEQKQTFFHTFARVGEQRGVFKNGIRGLGDTVGEFAARYAEFDLQNQEHLRFRWFAGMRNYLEAVDTEAGIYRIPWDEAPEPFGCNIVRLDPLPDSKEIAVDFRGLHDPATYSDWRACIVAVGKDGKCRYSPMWNKGLMKMERRVGDKRYWLTVAGTPTALLGTGALKKCYEGRWACRYPWQVTLAGAVPGAPQHSRVDLDDVYGSCGPWCVRGPEGILPPNRADVPVTASTDRGRHFVKQAATAIAHIDQRLQQTESILQRNGLLALRSKVQNGIADANGAPHPNGGGWVAATAYVAPTAYVGPKAMVLESASVLDHASVEEFAVLMDAVELSGHARVNGQAIIRGKTRLAGYQRVWQSIETKSAEEAMPELTPRDRALGLDGSGLWANYAMDETQASMLENRYRHRNKDLFLHFTDSLMNGYLHGRPTLKVEGERRGYAFDGKTQYAELAPRIADVGSITVDISLKWQGSSGQTLLDFGANRDNRFVLMLGRGGKPEFTAVVGGKNVATLKASAPVKHGEWARVRLEIDGAKVALWVNGSKAGQKKSAFRPAAAFPSGTAKRNFIAASREGSAKFAGVIDSVVIYHKVHGEAFAKLPPPVLDASRNPTKRFITELRKKLIAQKPANDRKQARIEKAMRHYQKLTADAAVRMYELRHRSPEWADGLERRQAFMKRKKETEDSYRKDAQQDPALVKLRTERDTIQKKIAELRQGQEEALPKNREDLRATEKDYLAAVKDPQYHQWKSELFDAEDKLKALEQRVAAALAAMPDTLAAEKEIARINKERGEIKLDVRKLEAEAFAPEAERFKHWDVVRNEITAIGKFTGRHASGNGPGYYRILGAQSSALQNARKYREEELRQDLAETNPDYKRFRELTSQLTVLSKRAAHRRELAYAMEEDYEDIKDRAMELRRHINNRERHLRRLRPSQAAASPELTELQGKSEALRRKIDTETRSYRDRRTREDQLPQQATENNTLMNALFEKVMETHYLESHAAMAFIRSGMAGWKNQPYGSYISGKAGGYDIANGAENHAIIRDDVNALRGIARTYEPENWATRVDQWDWRTPYEADGRIKNLPLTQKWLRRVRGK